MEAHLSASDLRPPHCPGLLLCQKIGRTLFRRRNSGLLSGGKGAAAFTEDWLCSGSFAPETSLNRAVVIRRVVQVGQELLEGRGFPPCFPWLYPWGLEQHLALKEMAFGACLMSMNSATWVFVLILGSVLFPLGFGVISDCCLSSQSLT